LKAQRQKTGNLRRLSIETSEDKRPENLKIRRPSIETSEKEAFTTLLEGTIEAPT